jgi:hypothetical protein
MLNAQIDPKAPDTRQLSKNPMKEWEYSPPPRYMIGKNLKRRKFIKSQISSADAGDNLRHRVMVRQRWENK